MDIQFIRNQFPGLKSGFIFMDNAGGSQILGNAVEEISEYLINSNVQLGATYKTSALAGDKLKKVTRQIAGFLNTSDPKEIVIGPTSTMQLRILSLCISRQWKEGDEVIFGANMSASPVNFTMNTSGEFENLNNSEVINLEENMEMNFGPWEYRILTK